MRKSISVSLSTYEKLHDAEGSSMNDRIRRLLSKSDDAAYWKDRADVAVAAFVALQKLAQKRHPDEDWTNLDWSKVIQATEE